jgi:hypothetical protein
VALRLIPNVYDRALQIAHAQGSKVISGRPLKPRPRHVPVSICNAGARALESLKKPGKIRTRREFHDEMNVVPHDTDLYESHAVAAGDFRKNSTEEFR